MIKNKGSGLEIFVSELYKDLGYRDVKVDYRVKKTNGEESANGQIDVTYKDPILRKYVECKYRTNSNVTFDDYSKFETTLKTFNIPTYLGEMVTNRYFDEKVKLRAKESKIRLIDRDELQRLEQLRKSGWRLAIISFRFFETLNTDGISYAMKYVGTRLLSMDQQIRKYMR